MASPVFACDEDSDAIPLSEVPESVLQAVRDAREGIILESAALIHDDDGLLYEVEGDFDGVDLEFLLTPDGDILEFEED